MRLNLSKSWENRKKITRLNFQNLVFLLAKNRYFIIIAFKMLKMDFKFMYTIVITALQSISASLFQFILKLFLNFSDFEPQYCYTIIFYNKIILPEPQFA